MDGIELNRKFMRSNFAETEKIKSDQELELPQPPLEKPYDQDAVIIDLPKYGENVISKKEILACMKSRRSRRKYSKTPLSMEELSFLLWATQGVDKVVKNNYATLRPVPSGGARHAFETYLAVNNVDGLNKGIYRYLPLEHKLSALYNEDNIGAKIISATMDQKFTGQCAVTFIWSCIPYRSEWRYSVSAHKTMLLDAGHICQNLYLACEAVGCGTCAIAAYDQKLLDDLIKVDGNDEFSVYLASVGKK
ncbi:MAG: SagB/ThcOx family dehydrogenase [Caulobacteraceae bacterium]